MTAPAAVPAATPAKCDFSVTLAADNTFAFNKALLTKSAKANLDNAVIAKLSACASVQSVIITGHADRLGSQSYNQKLSERRAQAVKDYLVGKGVAAQRLNAVGKGAADPVAQCQQKQRSALMPRNCEAASSMRSGERPAARRTASLIPSRG